MKFIEIKEQIYLHQERITQGLPESIQRSKMLSSIIYAIGQKVEVQKCSIGSILGSSIVACNLGLMPDGILGEGYFATLKDKCQFIPGYKGLERLAYRSGKIKVIYAEVVYKDELGDFNVTLGTDKRIDHRPNLMVKQTEDNIVAFYAVYITTEDVKDFKVLSRQEVDDLKVRYMTVGDHEHAWVNFFPAMGKKSAITQLLKHANLSTDIQYAIGLIETNLAGKDQQLSLHLENYLDELVEADLEAKNADLLEEKAAQTRKKIFKNSQKIGKK